MMPSSKNAILPVGTRLRSGRGKATGFTLIELMIVVLVIAVLMAIAYASYQGVVVKSRRVAAEGCLMEHAQFMERYYTTNFTYVGGAAPACDADVTKFYTVGFVADPTRAAFTLQAAPKANQRDGKCGTLTLDEKGQRGESGTGSVDDCW